MANGGIQTEFLPLHLPPESGLHADDRIFHIQLMNLETLHPVASIAATLAAACFTWKRLTRVIDVPLHQRCIHSRHGRVVKVLESGRYRFFGTGHAFQSFDTRLQPITLQTQELCTAEGITVKITAVGLYRIIDPVLAVSSTSDYAGTLYTLIQLALRDAVNGIHVETLMADVRALGPKLLEAVKSKANGLGIDLSELVIRDLILPADIKAALSESWRSKKSALAEIETARGKAAAARTMANASRLYENHPALLKIRYIEAIEQAAKSIGNTFVIGLPDEKNLHKI